MPIESAPPSGYHSVQPYLIFQDALAAIDFYKRAFGAVERLCMKDSDGHVRHAELVFGDSCIMLADEAPAINAFSCTHYGGCPITLQLHVTDCDATYKTALEAGATGKREPADQAYGDRTAGLTDPFGYTWYLATHIYDLSQQELEALMK